MTLVYLLDPSFNLLAAASIVAFLESFALLAGSRLQSVVVVGVGYDTQDLREIMALRALDFTPTAQGGKVVPLPPFQFGGAAAFLDALVDEVSVAVERQFPGRNVTRVLAGHSLGGLFTLFALFRRHDAFAGYMTLSPSLWWDEQVMLREAEAWRPASTRRTAVFAAVGEKEQAPGGAWRNENFSDDVIRGVRQVENFRKLSSILSRNGSSTMAVDSVVLAEEYHLTVFPAAFGRGLRFILDSLA